jgi:hypothetical protein
VNRLGEGNRVRGRARNCTLKPACVDDSARRRQQPDGSVDFRARIRTSATRQSASSIAWQAHSEPTVAQDLAPDRDVRLGSCRAQGASGPHRDPVSLGLSDDDPSSQGLLGVLLNLNGIANQMVWPNSVDR